GRYRRSGARAPRTPSWRAHRRPMRRPMVDRALVVAVCGAVAGLAIGVVGVVVGSPVWGVGAGAAGGGRAAAAVTVARTARPAEERLAASHEDVKRLHRELDALAAILEDGASRHEEELEAPPARPSGEHAFDPATGLYDERYFAVLVQQQVAAARRSLRPVSVVIFEVDAMHEEPNDKRDQALSVVGDVVRRTLRESD